MIPIRNNDKVVIAYLALLQLSGVLFGTMLALFQNPRDCGWCYGIVPVMWIVGMAYLRNSTRWAGVARTVTVVSGIILWIAIYYWMFHRLDWY